MSLAHGKRYESYSIYRSLIHSRDETLHDRDTPHVHHRDKICLSHMEKGTGRIQCASHIFIWGGYGQ